MAFIIDDLGLAATAGAGMELGKVAGQIGLSGSNRLEVKPAEAVVIKNIWTGDTEVVFAGTKILMPGVHEVEERVTLRIEKEDPNLITVRLADGVEVKVDLIYEMRIAPFIKKGERFSFDEALARSVLLAVLEISYKNRHSMVLDTIEEILERRIGTMVLNDLTVGDTAGDSTVDSNVVARLTRQINARLRAKTLRQWGLDVKVNVKSIVLPPSKTEAAEKTATAKQEGEALKEKATAAGVHPALFAVVDAFQGIFGGKK